MLTALALLTLMATAQAEGLAPKPVQRAVIHANRIAEDVHKFMNDRSGKFDRMIDRAVPLDDFKLTFEPNWKKTFNKKEFRYSIGFKFTF